MICLWNYEKVLVNTAGITEVQEKVDIWGRKVKANRASIITEDQALEAFGYPTQGATASTYRQLLYMFRNNY
jgi:hypothetical protein